MKKMLLRPVRVLRTTQEKGSSIPGDGLEAILSAEQRITRANSSPGKRGHRV